MDGIFGRAWLHNSTHCPTSLGKRQLQIADKLKSQLKKFETISSYFRAFHCHLLLLDACESSCPTDMNINTPCVHPSPTQYTEESFRSSLLESKHREQASLYLTSFCHGRLFSRSLSQFSPHQPSSSPPSVSSPSTLLSSSSKTLCLPLASTKWPPQPTASFPPTPPS